MEPAYGIDYLGCLGCCGEGLGHKDWGRQGALGWGQKGGTLWGTGDLGCLGAAQGMGSLSWLRFSRAGLGCRLL